MDISVIIPHYNSYNMLIKLLDTIPEDARIEILVVDDHSDDQQQYEDVIKKYRHRQNIIFLQNEQEKKGAGAARNVGLNNASGQWIVFADSDDYFVDGAFDIFFEHVNSDSDIIYFALTSIDLSTGKLSDRHDKITNLLHYYLKKRNLFSELLIKVEWCGPIGKMFRRSMVLDNDCRFTEIIAANDIMFSVVAAISANKIEAYDDKVYCITKSSHTLTQNKSYEIMNIRLQEEINVYNYLKQALPSRDYKMLHICGIYHIINGFKLFGIKRAMEIIKEYKKNDIPLFKIGILRNFWIGYHNRII